MTCATYLYSGKLGTNASDLRNYLTLLILFPKSSLQRVPIKAPNLFNPYEPPLRPSKFHRTLKVILQALYPRRVAFLRGRNVGMPQED